MNEPQYQITPLVEIATNPWNPRRKFEGPRFDEFMASVAENGVLEPVLIRPLPDGECLCDIESCPTAGLTVKYELVAGERRFRAACRVALKNGGLDGRTIPALVREMSDDEAFDVMTIENLQREDLSEMEEAEGFKFYLDRYGKEALPELAARTGIDPRYIRRRTAVLDLPKKALQGWADGRLKYGHLEQLLRVRERKQRAEWIRELHNHRMSVRDMRRRIDHIAPRLDTAVFDLGKAGCPGCHKNSEVQKKLFDMDADGKKCLDPACFKRKLNNHLLAHWKKSEIYKKCRTNGFRFARDLNWNDYEEFYGRAGGKKCKTCDRYATLIHLDGQVSKKRVCIGDKACFRRQAAERRKAETAKTQKEPKDPDAPRVAWHGEYFREKFYHQQIPLRMEAIERNDLKVEQLALLTLVKAHQGIHAWFAQRHKLAEKSEIDEWYRLATERIFGLVVNMDPGKVREEIRAVTSRLVVSDVYYSDERRMVAGHIGIELEKEWAITEEYLQKKTISEMQAMGRDLKIFADPAAQAYLNQPLGKKGDSFKGLKKGELIEVFLKSGVDLSGKVPGEIVAQ